MKNFFKKLAFMLALLMVVNTATPVVANAASAPVLNTSGKVLYLDGDETGKYTDTFTLKVWNKGDYRVTYKSLTPEIAEVSKWWGTVTAKSVGTAVIEATVTDLETGKEVAVLTAKVWVKNNAEEVGFSTASVAKVADALSVGDSVKLNAFRKDGDTVAWSTKKDAITDYIVYESSNPAVATVSKWGTVTAVSAGEATITATAYQTEGKTATTASASVTVTVKSKGITNVAQTTKNTIKLTFGSDMSEVVTKDTLVITPANAANQAPVIKSVTWNDDKTVATVVSYVDFTNEAAYSISVKDNDSIKGEFVASVADVAAISITGPSSVVVNELTRVPYTLTDKNGVEVSAKSGAYVEIKVLENETNGYTSESYTDKDYTNVWGVSVFEKGKNVVLQAIYHTGEYTNEGEEIVIKSNAFVVTGMDKTDATLGTAKYTVTTGKYGDINWDTYTQNLRITMENQSYKIQAYVKDSTGKEYKTDDTSAFKFESMDETKVVVAADGTLYPVAEGSAYVKVTVVDCDKSFMVKVTVAPKAKISSFVANAYSATVSNAVGVDNNTTFKLTVKDQYAQDINVVGSDMTISTYNNTLDASSFLDTTEKNKITFKPEGAPAGTYSFKVTVGDFSRIFTVTVKEPGAETKRVLVVSDSTFNKALSNSNDGAKSITFNYYAVDKNGIRVSKLALGSDYTISVKNPAGTEVATGSALEVLAVSGSAITKTKAAEKTGTYTVTLYNGTKVLTKSAFSITDSQVVPTIKQKETSVSLASSTLETIKDAFGVSTTNKSEGVEITGVQFKKVGHGDTVYTTLDSLSKDDKIIITKFFVTEKFDSGKEFTHEISKSLSLTIK